MAEEQSARTALEPFLLHNVQEGPEIGHGACAVVFEISYKGLKCAAKKIHPILRESRGYILKRFIDECRILSQVSHPHIVQFIGVYFEGSSSVPVLVMEYLPATLVQCIDRYGRLPAEITMMILQDVAVGLRFLHENTPAIIHRDLSANNVLLTLDMRAKISDLGVAKILSINPTEVATMTQAPGTLCYMPPEALIPNPRYSIHVDVFSYGVMMVHILSGKWPFPSEAVVAGANDTLTPLSEASRRSDTISEIAEDHPLLALIERCLKNNALLRPTAEEIHETVKRVAFNYPLSYENRVEMLLQIKSLQDRNRTLAVEKHTLQTKSREFERMHEDSQTANSLEYEEKVTQLADLKAEIDHLEAKLESNTFEHSAHMQAKERELSAANAFISSKNEVIDSLLNQAQKARDALRDRGKTDGASSSCEEAGLLTPNTKLVWTECAELPAAMFGAQAVVINGDVYVGGGGTGDDATRRMVFKYIVAQDQWSNLPDSPVIRFGIGSIRGKLVLVGGALTRNAQVSKAILVFENDEWEGSQVSPMITERCAPGVISHRSGLVVAGGNNRQVLKCVEVYNADDDEWFAVGALPVPWNWMSSVAIEDNCFLVRGYISLSASSAVRSAYSASLLRLFAAKDDEHRSFASSGWLKLADVPTYRSTVTTISGCLLAVGGQNGPTEGPVRSTIYAYCPTNRAWLEVGEMPGARSDCAAVTLPSGEILIIGGWNGNFQRTATVFKCSLEFAS